MFNGKYVSIKSIMATLVKYPFIDNISSDDLGLYLSEFLRKVGAPLAFTDKVVTIEIKNNRGMLPCDLLYIRGTRALFPNDCNDCGNDEYIALAYASDIYHSSYHCSDTIDECNKYNDYTYSLNNGAIYTSFKEGEVQMSYRGLVVDEEGYPMLPDDVKVKEAFKYYVLMQYAEPAYFRKDIPKDIYYEIKQQYAWYIGAAQNSLNMPNSDQMQTLQNGIIRLLRNTNWQEDGWRTFAQKEYITGVNKN